MEQPPTPTNSAWPFPFPQQDWEQTPPAVQAYLLAVQQSLIQVQARVEALEARLNQNSTTSHRPPSSDNPYKKPRHRSPSTTPRKAGGQPGHAGHRQVLLPPTAVHALRPERCPCGNTTFAATKPYYTHQVIELPPIELEVQHFVLHQGWCTACGTRNNARVPPSMPRAMDHGSARSWASWRGRTGMAVAWCKPCAPRSSGCPSAWELSRR